MASPRNYLGLGLMAALPLLLLACPRPPPPPPEVTPGPPPIRVPPGCEADLSGRYVHAERADWQYLASDDGGTLVLELRREFGDGGSPDAGSDVRVILRRTPEGFVGEVPYTVFPAPGVRCDVAFDVALTACEDAGITLSSAEEVQLDPACQRPVAGPSPTRREDRLVRAPEAGAAPPSADAGATIGADAGAGARADGGLPLDGGLPADGLSLDGGSPAP